MESAITVLAKEGIFIPAEIKKRKIENLIPYVNNARTHSKEQIARIAKSIKEFGFTNPVLIDRDDGIIAGHGRIDAAKLLGFTEVPTICLEHLTEAQKKAYIIADNRIALDAGWNDDILSIDLANLRDLGYDLTLTGLDNEELERLVNIKRDADPLNEIKAKLTDKFLVPPFSVLDARQGYWIDRKKIWLGMGIESECGRGGNLLKFSDQCNMAQAGKKPYGTMHPGKTIDAKNGEKYEGGESAWQNNGTSIFDPVLCELAYRWFSPKAGSIIDPFAGGSVRGIVAAKCGRQYIGVDLRGEQIEANRQQWEKLGGADELSPVWRMGDSRHILKIAQGVDADLIFSCPPYANLEVYSDDPNDLSTLEYDEFIKAYSEIIANTCALLKNDRFACFVVGEVRHKKGHYYNFVGDTVNAFLAAGLKYYNEAILVTAIGSLPIRAGKQFQASRKIGKTHQNVLVFVKGDAKAATLACGEIEINDIEAETGEL